MSDTHDLQSDAPTIERHLNLLFDPYDHAIFEIRALHRDKPPESETFHLSDVATAIEYAEGWNELGFNVYVGINPRDREQPNASDDFVSVANYHVIDWDGITVADRDARLLKNGFQPAFTVLTGSMTAPVSDDLMIRCHENFRLDRQTDDMTEWTRTQKALAITFGSDRSIINPSRIMRLAGTVSYPNEKKRQKGYQPELVRLIEHDAPSVDASAFRAHFSPEPARSDHADDYAPMDGDRLVGTPAALLRAAFAVIPATDNRETWRDLGMSAKAFDAGAESYDAWTQWSRLSGSFDLKDQRKTWNSFRPGIITERKLLAMATANDPSGCNLTLASE